MASPQQSKPNNPRGARGSSRSPVLPPSTAPTRKPVKKGPHSSPQSLQEVKKANRLRRTPERELCDQLQGLDLGREQTVEGTGLVYDEHMTLPYCLWDSNFPECPARLLAVNEKLKEYKLIDRCVPVPAREATDKEILLVHSPQFLELMKSTQNMNEEQLHTLSDLYDSVYLHPSSFAASCLAAGSVLQLVDNILSGKIRNGMAVIRPPGHHAHIDQMNGYCMFNQLAIAARYAQFTHGIRRVLIVDWDVHHGQGTQFIFESDPSVLYFSLHRYEDGRFWPHLAESSSSSVGKEQGSGFTINVPWNKTGMTDADYIVAFLHLLLPVCYEFNPQLVLVAAGFDSVMGDPKGEMSATPACFAHLTHLLMSLAQGRLILSLEGGYNQRSLAEGVCASLKILLGDPCPNLSLPCSPCQSALNSVSEAIVAHSKFWKYLQDWEKKDEPTELGRAEGQPRDGMIGVDLPNFPTELDGSPNKVESRTDTPAVPRKDDNQTSSNFDNLMDTVMRDVMRVLPVKRTGLVYDQRMMEHYNLWDSHHPELPQRISRIYNRHEELGLLKRCIHLPSRLASQKELQMCHNFTYIQKMEKTAHMKPRDLHRLGSEYNSIYINDKSYNSACLAAGSVFSAVEAVINGEVQNAVCIVRPPGHHAEKAFACGFCFFNTVALAARYAQSLQSPSYPPLRHDDSTDFLLTCGITPPGQQEDAKSTTAELVMILDWDVHHGNGTQHIFQEDASVLYVSIHRYDHGLFFPCSEDAAHDKVGTGQGEGFNVNIPWNGAKMGDPEYLMAFHRVVMPIAYEFNPQLVLVSAGFDAARGDPLGGCQVTPEGYAHMTHLLMGLAGGRVVVVLEGGYNLTSISESMVMCTQTLLGDPPAFILERRPLRVSALRSLHNVLNVQRQYWHGLRLNVTVKSSHLESTEDQTTPSKNIRRKSRSVESTGPSPHKPVTTADMGNTGAVALTSQHVEPEHSFDAPPSVTQEKDNSASLCLQNNVANELVRKVETPERIPLEGLEREGETLKNVLHEDIERENPECMSQKKPDNDDEILQGNLHEICASDTPGHLHHHEKQSPRSPSHQGLSEHYQHEELREGETTLHDLMRKCPIHNPYVQIVSKDCVCQSHQDTVTNRETLEVSQHALISLTDKEAHKHLVYERTEVKGETAEQDLPRAASPSEQLLDFKHLQLGDEMDNSSLVISLEDTSPWEGARREAVLCKGGETRDKVANRCEKTSEETQMRLDLQNDDKLLSEAAGGCDTTLPSTLCQIFVDPLLGDSETGFAVLPLSWCPHLTSVREVPTGGLNVSQPCAECNTQLENWVCLTCYQVLCGRYVSKHMLLHGVTSGHHLVLSFSDISVWCYGCESYVHHEVLLPAKCSAYYDKFGEEMTII